MKASEPAAELHLPMEISGWLGKTLLLYGVPFHYLVPDERMLPEESIRFFHLDPAWIKCLLEGALSVGRVAKPKPNGLDETLSNNFLDHVPRAAAAVREAAKQPERSRKGGVGDVKIHWPLSGFLIRSQVVEGWQGLEVKARGVDQDGQELDPLQPLRIDRLGPDILLSIFNGRVTWLQVKQPPEGMHFGASPKSDNWFEKLHLRSVTDGEHQVGGQVEEAIRELPMRMAKGTSRNRGSGVVDVLELRDDLKTGLKNAGVRQEGDEFTSAEYALEMVEAPGKVIFQFRP